MTLLTDLQNAGLPVLTATEGVSAVFNRSLSDEEMEVYLNILYPQRQAQAARLKQSRVTAKAIPNWATWSQADWDAYFAANLSTTLVNAVSTTAQIRVMMNKQNLVIQNLVKLIIAMRDQTWPDL
jgi:hypothetical protein